MVATLFTNVRIFDGGGAEPFLGEALVSDRRVRSVSREPIEGCGGADVTIVDGGGATLMPGLTEAHAHLSWPTSVERFVPGMQLPPEDLLLNTARNARVLLDHGYTSAYSAGSLGKTLETSLKFHIDSGSMPGPRLIASSLEQEPPSENSMLDAGKATKHARGPDGIREFVKSCAAIGAKAVKFLLSGESALKPGASHELLYTEEEIQAAGEEARACDVWLSGHAHASGAIKLGMRHGFRMLYHCTYADSEALDMLEARRDSIFVGPTIGIVQATLDAKPPPHMDMRHMKADAAIVLEHQIKLVPELRQRGIRVVPGGDYGFPFNPNGRNARDLELFVRHFGYTPSEVLSAATQLGGEVMGMETELGKIAPGYLADLLLVRGDPTRDISILQSRDNLLAIMKDGHFYKEPPIHLRRMARNFSQ